MRVARQSSLVDIKYEMQNTNQTTENFMDFKVQVLAKER